MMRMWMSPHGLKLGLNILYKISISYAANLNLIKIPSKDDCFDPKSSTIVKTCNECYELLYAYHVTVTGNKQPEDNKMSTIWRMGKIQLDSRNKIRNIFM